MGNFFNFADDFSFIVRPIWINQFGSIVVNHFKTFGLIVNFKKTFYINMTDDFITSFNFPGCSKSRSDNSTKLLGSHVSFFNSPLQSLSYFSDKILKSIVNWSSFNWYYCNIPKLINTYLIPKFIFHFLSYFLFCTIDLKPFLNILRKAIQNILNIKIPITYTQIFDRSIGFNIVNPIHIYKRCFANNILRIKNDPSLNPLKIQLDRFFSNNFDWMTHIPLRIKLPIPFPSSNDKFKITFTTDSHFSYYSNFIKLAFPFSLIYNHIYYSSFKLSVNIRFPPN